MTELILSAGKVYRAKKPKQWKVFPLTYDDRQICQLTETRVSYCTAKTNWNKPLPCTSVALFRKWAGKDVT